jgi:hypothetical protein
MTDQEQLIAVAEVLGQNYRSVLPWLNSLDACWADIVPSAKGYFELSRHPATGEWYCYFGPRNGAFDATAPRAVVKAFLVHNNRWVDRPDNQRKGGND